MEHVNLSCHRCGSSALSDGDLVGLDFGFKPDDCKFWVAGTSKIQVRAHMCRRCGELQLEGDLGKLQRLDPAKTG